MITIITPPTHYNDYKKYYGGWCSKCGCHFVCSEDDFLDTQAVVCPGGCSCLIYGNHLWPIAPEEYRRLTYQARGEKL
jgi:hypothetical protein